MEYLNIHGEKFFKLIGAELVDETVLHSSKVLENELNENSGALVVVMANGANWFAQRLFQNFENLPLHIEYVRIESYSGSKQGEIEMVSMPKPEEVNGRSVIIVEDIIDSGKTMDFIQRWMYDNGASKVAIIALCRREGTLMETANIPIEIPKGEWLVGCGMDHFHEGRNLGCIYSKVK
ncbi:MAG: hypothetical protein MJ198_00990 [Bacteroidales bacterium]|nr:hypothetical protein [Bacteroidales bacterium]